MHKRQFLLSKPYPKRLIIFVIILHSVLRCVTLDIIIILLPRETNLNSFIENIRSINTIIVLVKSKGNIWMFELQSTKIKNLHGKLYYWTQYLLLYSAAIESNSALP